MHVRFDNESRFLEKGCLLIDPYSKFTRDPVGAQASQFQRSFLLSVIELEMVRGSELKPNVVWLHLYQ